MFLSSLVNFGVVVGGETVDDLATKWINGDFPFVFNKSTGFYDQPEATVEFLKFISSLNPHLSSIALQKTHKLGAKTLKTTDSMADLLSIGSSDPTLSSKALDALSTELCACTSPVLVTMDMLPSLHLQTKYHDDQGSPLLGRHFTLLNFFASLMNGKHSMVGDGCLY